MRNLNIDINITFSFLLAIIISFRKRSFEDGGDNHDEIDFDSTRDSVLSGNSQSSFDNCDPELMIIDFEYCAYNYRGFDLANHFIEWTIDYTHTSFPFYSHNKNKYPTDEQQVSNNCTMLYLFNIIFFFYFRNYLSLVI